MNASSSTSTALSSRPGFDPVFGQFGGLFRTTLRGLRMQWFLYRGRREKTRSIESVGEMNAHMLRDIGAPEEMIASSKAARPAYERHGIPFGFAVLIVALALGGTGMPTSAQTVAQANTSATVQVQVAKERLPAVFAGEYVNGAPVYRVPAVVVIGTRHEGSIARSQPCRQMLANMAKSRA